MKELVKDCQFRLWGSLIGEGDFAVPKKGEGDQIYLRRVRALLRENGLDAQSPLAIIRPVHGRQIFQVHPVAPKVCDDVDGLMTHERGVILGVTGADCPPVLLFHPQSEMLALLHSGRRGTEGEIARAGVKTICGFGGVKPHHIRAYIGPGICQRDYPVDFEAAKPFLKDYRPFVQCVADNRYQVDLRRIIQEQLMNAGVPPKQVIVSSECTFESSDEWYSYRRLQRDHPYVQQRPRNNLFLAWMPFRGT